MTRRGMTTGAPATCARLIRQSVLSSVLLAVLFVFGAPLAVKKNEVGEVRKVGFVWHGRPQADSAPDRP